MVYQTVIAQLQGQRVNFLESSGPLPACNGTALGVLLFSLLDVLQISLFLWHVKCPLPRSLKPVINLCPLPQ